MPGHVGRAAMPEGTVSARRVSESWMLSAVLVLVLVAWDVSQRDLFEPGDDLGYWLGVAGGVAMLALLLYPLRKRVRAFQRWGAPKVWLWGHMLLGIGGPLLILVHCKFRAGSLNAAAALYAMVVVAVSGLVGRLLYVRVNRGLAIERRALDWQRAKVQVAGQSVVSFVPTISESLVAFEQDALKAVHRAGSHWVRLVMVLPLQSWVSRIRAQRNVRVALRGIAASKQWDAHTLRRRTRRARREVADFYGAVMRVALFSAWERLFALWHVAHLPFVFLLVVAGVVHVVAVHAY